MTSASAVRGQDGGQPRCRRDPREEPDWERYRRLERTATEALRLALMSAAAAAGTVSWRCWNTLGSGHWTSADLTPLKLGVAALVAAVVAVASVSALAVAGPTREAPPCR